MPPNCDDGIDNDEDGLTDLEDPDCLEGGIGELPPEEDLFTVNIDDENIVTINYSDGWFGSETVIFTATDQTDAMLSDSDGATFRNATSVASSA